MRVEPGPEKARPRPIWVTRDQRIHLGHVIGGVVDDGGWPVDDLAELTAAWDRADPGDVIVPARALAMLIARASLHDPVAVAAADELQEVLDR